MKEIQEHLSRNMKKYRKNHGFSQALLAEQVNCAPNYISLIEQGKKFPSPAMLERIAFALDVDSSDLFVALDQEVKIRDQIEKELVSAITAYLHPIFSVYNESSYKKSHLKKRETRSIVS